MDDEPATLAARAQGAQNPNEGLRAITQLRRRLVELEERHVDAAVAGGWSWTQIGRSLNISRQAAHRRHAGREPSPSPSSLGTPRTGRRPTSRGS